MTKEISPKHTEKTKKISERVDLGSLSAAPLEMSSLFPPRLEACHILIGTGREDFVASRIAHAVEDADANLLNLNVTSLSDSDNSHIVALRVDHRDPQRVARSLERYGYNIVDLALSDRRDGDDDVLRAKINEFIHYISV